MAVTVPPLFTYSSPQGTLTFLVRPARRRLPVLVFALPLLVLGSVLAMSVGGLAPAVERGTTVWSHYWGHLRELLELRFR